MDVAIEENKAWTRTAIHRGRSKKEQEMWKEMPRETKKKQDYEDVTFASKIGQKYKIGLLPV